ncbi:ubiquitin-binding protein cue5 [Pseudogymnoascus verrucosus]|uniref:Ubiquitin-binding protein cue5 n=1 Tax=Pseudogymnoascus verrucosus TaxID=342668 RepID=A0A1B8GG48_9PEZI|nr:ubiquitin-binding protein cue5 [Pseudogymnoascus verrucosus]OBT94783.1 ubiquitin-binding protein cue5 [Pseudogymnoascus verrucosus]
MSSPKRTESPPPTKTSSGAESPTTARPLEMDDDDVQETPVASGGEQTTAPAGQPAAGTTTEQAPAKPPRPLSAQQQAENTLKEAFPGVEAAVIKAVLIASGGKIEPAFNALLGMTDPEAAAEAAAIAEQAPPQPPRPARAGPELTQLEADELYARQLAEHFDSTQDRNRNRGGPQRGPNQRSGSYHEEDEYSFMDDDLPVIKENLRKGFIETQSKVNGWFTNLKKRIDGDDLSDIHDAQQRQEQGYNQGFQNQQYNSRRGDTGRRSGDSGRYDADPQVLSDDFTGIQLNDDTSNARRSTRPLANPDLFKPTPATPRSNDGSRKVSFQDGPPEEIDVYGGGRAAKDAAATTPASGKQSKWQPLSSVDPNPVGEGDNDPFSLGDSEDEKEVKAGVKEGKEEVKKSGGAAEGSEVKSETAEAGKDEKKDGAKDA